MTWCDFRKLWKMHIELMTENNAKDANEIGRDGFESFNRLTCMICLRSTLGQFEIRNFLKKKEQPKKNVKLKKVMIYVCCFLRFSYLNVISVGTHHASMAYCQYNVK